MHHAFVVRAGPDVVGLCVIAVGVCWTVGRPEGGRGCVWAGLSPRLGPGSLELCTHRLTYAFSRMSRPAKDSPRLLEQQPRPAERA